MSNKSYATTYFSEKTRKLLKQVFNLTVKNESKIKT